MQSVLLRASGLYSFPNHLSAVPQGALLRALNVVINRDNIAESRRGLKIYGNAMGASVANTAHQLLTYKGRLLRHYGIASGTTIQFDSDGAGSFSSFSGTYNEVVQGLRIKGIEANSNFYFTTFDGIKKISVSQTSELVNASITSAGGIKALDLKSSLNSTPGFFTQESTVAYRLVWGIKDANNNLILGSPSERSVIYNPLTPLLAADFNTLLAHLDTCHFGGGINDANYVSSLGVASNVSAFNLRTNLIALTSKIDNDVTITALPNPTISHQRVSTTQGKVVFTSSLTNYLQVGDKVNFTSLGSSEMNNNVGTITALSTTTVSNDTITFAPTINYSGTDGSPVADTTGVCKRVKYTLITNPVPLDSTPTSAELESMQAYYDTIVSELQNELSGICTGSTFNTDNSTQSSTVDLVATIPQGVTLAHFYQLYRTALTTSQDVVVLSTLDPGDEEQLVFEGNPNATDLSNGYITIHDITPDSFRGANLYTNPNTGDGILQANEVPPVAKDICLFKGYTFFANTRTKQQLQFSMLSVVDLVSNQSTFTISDGTNTNTYTFSSSENIAAKKVLISTLPTPAQQVDESARSLVRVINRNASEVVYAYYLSGPNDVPGMILLESRSLSEPIYYISTDSSTTAGQFSPNLYQPTAITNISVANPTVVTSVGHGLSSGNQIIISGSNSTPSIDGIYTVNVTGVDAFTVPVHVTVLGTHGGWLRTSQATVSDNSVSPNRIFYSKINQPEAVPIVNYLDIGPQDKNILRILALRDNLFVLKEEGIYRLSGLVAPFTVTLFDSSTILKASDSAVVLNNLIYMASSQGVAQISDTGVKIISRPIEDKLIKLASAQYPNFPTATFGVSYESDRTYYLWTVTNTGDTFATQCFRYNTFTNSWCESDKSARCGVVDFGDDKMYLGPTDTNFIEQERKTFDRTDYADREITTSLNSGNINGSTIILPSITNMTVGDVLVQTQYFTINQFNQILTKLDSDSILTFGAYSNTFKQSTGATLNTALDSLITQVANDVGRTGTAGATSIGTYTALTPSPSDFASLQTTFNSFVTLLNADTGVGYSNYLMSNGSVLQEINITSINSATNTITTAYAYPFIVGPALVYNHIQVIVQWVPEYLQDSSMSKHVSEGSAIFEDYSFTTANMAYSSDLSPNFEGEDFNGSGNGVFGANPFGTGPFGGNGLGIPFRTYIPKNKQRCRYMNCKFTHSIAREIFSLYGISLTYNPISQRAWR